MSASEGNKDKSMGIPDYEYTPNFRNALDHGSSSACFNVESLSQHFRTVPDHAIRRGVAAGRPRCLAALLSSNDKELRLVPIERGKVVSGERSAARALHHERLLVAGLQADGPDIGDEGIRTRRDRMLADFP